MTNNYVPIDCDQHSVLELLAMRRTPVVARVLPGSESGFSTEGVVCDVLSRNGAEYLILLDQSAGELSIRLDHLFSLSSPDGSLIWRQKNIADQTGFLTH